MKNLYLRHIEVIWTIIVATCAIGLCILAGQELGDITHHWPLLFRMIAMGFTACAAFITAGLAMESLRRWKETVR